MVNMVDKRKRKEEPEMLTVTEAARELGVGLTAVSKAISRGRLQFMQVKHLKLIPRSALEMYVKSKSKGGWPKGRPRKKA